MTNSNIDTKKTSIPVEAAISLGLFLLVVLPRAYSLQRFVTADEAKWVYRSAQFLAALLRGDFAGTSVNLTPGITTSWLGSFGLAIYYQLNQAALNLPFTDWLLSLPEFRTEMDILAATRWPMIIFSALAVVAIYWLLRYLFNGWVALIAAVLITLDPHTVALSRILGHDAPAALFMILSILLLFVALDRETKTHTNLTSPALFYVLSGAAAGLAFLSKAPAFFLVPFAALLFLSKLWGNSKSLFFWTKRFLIWGVAAWLAFTIFWPAAWVNPLGQPLTVINNAFLSATDQAEADDEGYWLVPELGPFYYLVNGAFKLSPLVVIGVIIALVYLVRHATRRKSESGHIWVWWLLGFAVLFTIFMTFGGKRSPRYILPIFPALAVVAATGWLVLYQIIKSRVSNNRHKAAQLIFSGLLVLAAMFILLPYAPYYFTYFNPLMGGFYTAPKLVKVGWGEGLDQVGRYLERELSGSRVGTAYASTVAPFFSGDLTSVTSDKLDYLVLYSKQVQSGEPSPTFIRYYQQMQPSFSVDIAGIHYADVYPGPALQPALTLTPGLDVPILPKPTGFRPLSPYGQIGQPLEVDITWLADDQLPASPSTLTLQPISAFDFPQGQGQDHDHDENELAENEPEITILAEGKANLVRVADDLVVSRHAMLLPNALSRGTYALLVDGRPLGEIELRHFDVPPDLGKVKDVIFDNQISLTGYQFEPSEDFVGITVAWQALQNHLPDYTVFAQLLDENGERVAGIDTPPLKGQWPTGNWVKDEVVVDEYFIAIPYGIQPGHYSIIVGLYDSQTGERLTWGNGQDHWVIPWTYIWNDKTTND